MSETPRSNVIDMISVDDAAGTVCLHALIEGGWSDYDGKMDLLLRKLNAYLFFVLDGQLARDSKYRGLPVRFLINSEERPPSLALVGFSRMREHLKGHGIGFAVTCGFDLSELSLPELENVDGESLKPENGTNRTNQKTRLF